MDLEQHFIFFPSGVEALGSWGPKPISFIHFIGRRVAANTGIMGLQASSANELNELVFTS